MTKPYIDIKKYFRIHWMPKKNISCSHIPLSLNLKRLYYSRPIVNLNEGARLW